VFQSVTTLSSVVLNFTLCEAEVIILQILIIVKNFFRICEDFLPKSYACSRCTT
jgi:hypothetical protein